MLLLLLLLIHFYENLIRILREKGYFHFHQDNLFLNFISYSRCSEMDISQKFSTSTCVFSTVFPLTFLTIVFCCCCYPLVLFVVHFTSVPSTRLFTDPLACLCSSFIRCLQSFCWINCKREDKKRKECFVSWFIAGLQEYWKKNTKFLLALTFSTENSLKLTIIRLFVR